MDYCGPRGIPHSNFLDWKSSDQEKALAWMIDEASRCGMCGSYPEEWLDADGRPVEPPPMYVRSRLCRGCSILHDEEEHIRSSYSSGKPPGIRLYLSRQPPPPREEDDSPDEV